MAIATSRTNATSCRKWDTIALVKNLMSGFKSKTPGTTSRSVPVLTPHNGGENSPNFDRELTMNGGARLFRRLICYGEERVVDGAAFQQGARQYDYERAKFSWTKSSSVRDDSCQEAI